MTDESARTTGTEEALNERVRQAEVLIGAQVAFLAATYQRTAVLAGVVFAIVAGLFGLTYTDLVDPIIIDLARKMSLVALAPLVLLVCATAITNADLPGAIDNGYQGATAAELKEALLDQYRISAKWNAVRLALSRYLIVSVALTMAAIGTFLTLEVRDYRAWQQFLADPALAARSWDDQSVGVREIFRQITGPQTEDEREARWNQFTPGERRSLFIGIAPMPETGPRSTTEPTPIPETEDGNEAGDSSRPATIGRGNRDNQMSAQ